MRLSFLLFFAITLTIPSLAQDDRNYDPYRYYDLGDKSANFTGDTNEEKLISARKLVKKIIIDVTAQKHICKKFNNNQIDDLWAVTVILLIDHSNNEKTETLMEKECDGACPEKCVLMTPKIRKEIIDLMKNEMFKSYLLNNYSPLQKDVNDLLNYLRLVTDTKFEKY